MYKNEYIIFIILLLCNICICGKSINIKSDDGNFENLVKTINDYQSENELILNFEDRLYDMTKILSNDISLTGNIIFDGKNKKDGVIFDYGNDTKGRFSFFLSRNKNLIIKFENIIFRNNYRPPFYENNQIIFVRAEKDHFSLQFVNCTFQNNNNDLIRLEITYKNQLNYEEPELYIENCNFHNNTESIIRAYHLSSIIEYGSYKDLKIHIKDSRFVNNKDLFYSSASQFLFENCYFSTIESDFQSNIQGSFITTNYGYIIIKNSIFENISIDGPAPLIYGSETTIDIEYSTFNNCTSDYGYLFHLSNFKNDKKKKKITVKKSLFQNTCSLFDGDNCQYEFLESTFQSFILKNPIPAISNSFSSSYKIQNTEFRNISLSNSLFGDLSSSFELKQSKMINIKTNYKYILSLIYKNSIINNLIVDQILCNGDMNDSSFILLDAGDSTKQLSINNINVSNSESNGSFIKLIGKGSELSIQDSNFKNIISYGPVIENQSNMVNIVLSNSTFENNINKDKLNCGGLHFMNNVYATIDNSTFINNKSKSNGGAICINNIMDAKLTINSNKFIKNQAINGGGLYIENHNVKIQNENNTIIHFNNNIFTENSASNFGGAIYSNYDKLFLANATNNLIEYNNAGIMGGGVYSPEHVEKTLFKLNNFEFHNNSVSSLINDYTTKPSYITLNTTVIDNTISVITGEYFSLNFNLYDEYHNIITDITKYYSSLTLKITLEYENKEEEEEEEEEEEREDYYKSKNLDYSIHGNICTFVNGKCELNNIQIFSFPKTYIFKINIDNYNDDISLNFSQVKVKVNDCKEEQIRMYNKNKILYCENPICQESCPVDISAKCQAYTKENDNDIHKNKCICMNGWTGENCKEKIFTDLSNVNKFILIISIPSIILAVLYIPFILKNRKIGIIQDTGLYRIILFCIGIILFYISLFFSTYTNFTTCMINFFFKHLGIFLITIIYYIYVSQGFVLGMEIIQQGRPTNQYFSDAKILNFNNYEMQYSNSSSIFSDSSHESDIDKRNKVYSVIKYSKKITFTTSESMESINNVIKSREKVASSILIKSFTIYVLFFVFLMITIISEKIKDIGNTDSNIVQDQSGEWSYKCQLERIDIIIYLLYMILYIIILWKGKQLFSYECIFFFTRNIFYSAFIGATSGPLVNIIGYFLLNKQKYGRTVFEVGLNSFCFLILFILFSWDKIYYIFKKKGNDLNAYFKLKNGDDLNKTKEDFLDVYKNCSKLKLSYKDNNEKKTKIDQ